MNKLLILVLTFVLTQACSPLKFAAINAPVLSYEGEIKQDIAYGQLKEQKLDIYIPQAQDAPLPVVIFFHGGRWTFGDKSQYKFVGMTLSNLGYVVVIPNTRLYPQVKFPVFIEDAAESVAWVHRNIDQYGGNQELFIAGHSSGAHMGALLIADQSYLKPFNLNPSIVSAFAGMAGPYDFEPQSEELKTIFGPPSNYPKMAVTHFIDGDEPPMLLIYTSDDDTVHIRNLRLLAEGIKRANGEVTTIIYDSGGHSASVSAFSWANPSDLPVPQDIHQFFQAHR
jgi:acetyl esterase/lipase